MNEYGAKETPSKRMDVTSIQIGGDTRDRLREYKDDHGYQNYDEAVRNLLQRFEKDTETNE